MKERTFHRGLNRNSLVQYRIRPGGCVRTKCRRIIAFVLATAFILASCSNDARRWQIGPFTRHPSNPILSPRGDGWETKDVFNPAAWSDGDRIWVLYRAEDNTGPGQWNGTSRIGVASSHDGLVFDRRPEPVLEPSEPWELPGGCEDPRLVKIEDLFYLTYTAYDGETARLALATSRDLEVWTKLGLMLPERGWTKAGAILTRPIDGKYWMYFGDTDLWTAYTADLRHWTVVETPVLKRRPGRFDSRVVEPGPPPLVTDYGILLLYNGADDNLVYAPGQALFDARDPTRLLARSAQPFLRPEAVEEREGQVPSVVFIQGLVRFKGNWMLYYGMADSHIGVATAPAKGD